MSNHQRPNRDGRPPGPNDERRPHLACTGRGRPITGSIHRPIYAPGSNLRNNQRVSRMPPPGEDNSPDESAARNEPSNARLNRDEDASNSNTPQSAQPAVCYYPPRQVPPPPPPIPPPPPPPLHLCESHRDFHAVPVFSGPFPIHYIPRSHLVSAGFNDAPIILGPFPLHNIRINPGSIPVHHIPYIPAPENVPHCPVLYEADENDPNLAYPGYTLLVPVPYGAIPAVQLYIIASNFVTGPTYLLIFQHGYIMPPRSHNIRSMNFRGDRNVRVNPWQMPCANAYRHVSSVGTPVVGLRIGRQPTPMRVQRGRGRVFNRNSQHDGFTQNMTFRYIGQPFSNSRRPPSAMGRRPNGQRYLQEFYRGNQSERGRGLSIARPLHSCGSNDPTHDCLWDQQRRRKPPAKKGKDAGKPEGNQVPRAILKTSETFDSKPAGVPPKKKDDAPSKAVSKDKNEDKEEDKENQDPDDLEEIQPVTRIMIVRKIKTDDAENENIEVIIVNESIGEPSNRNEESGSQQPQAVLEVDSPESPIPEVPIAEVPVEELPTPNVSTSEVVASELSTPEFLTLEVPTPEVPIQEVSIQEVSIQEVSTQEVVNPEKDVPKKKDKKKRSASKHPSSEDPGEGTSSSIQRVPRYRSSYNYLRNLTREPSDAEPVKIRNYDEEGNRVPTYRQALHYCTKYHEKQSRRKLRKQRRDGLFVPNPFGVRTLLDEWLGDYTTSDSDSDSSFLTDEGGDQSRPPNTKEMMAYYREIKAMKEEEKKKKKKK